MNYILDTYFGFGDNIYHISFVHKLAQRGGGGGYWGTGGTGTVNELGIYWIPLGS